MYTSTKNVKKIIFNFPSFKSFGFSSSKSNRIYIPDKPVSSELFKKYIHSWIPKTHWLIVLVRKFCRKKMLKGIDYLVSTSATGLEQCYQLTQLTHTLLYIYSSLSQAQYAKIKYKSDLSFAISKGFSTTQTDRYHSNYTFHHYCSKHPTSGFCSSRPAWAIKA